MATGRRNDREYRRRVGAGAIRRAAKGFKRLESDMDRARTRLYNTMRSYSDVFTEEELVELGPVSRPTVRKRVLGKDDREPEQTGGDGTGDQGTESPSPADQTPPSDPETPAATPDENPQSRTETG